MNDLSHLENLLAGIVNTTLSPEQAQVILAEVRHLLRMAAHSWWICAACRHGDHEDCSDGVAGDRCTCALGGHAATP
jgi:hypothetical protein